MCCERRWLRLLALAAGLSCFPAQADSQCGSSATPISAIQGSGTASPLAGKTVTVEAVLTLDSRHAGGFGGFYLQQSDDSVDQSEQTSEAVFVYTGHPGGQQGDRIRLTGRVKEYHGLTEMTSLSELHVCGAGKLPKAVEISLPWPGTQWPEPLENMRVTIREPLTLIEPHSFARFGELVLADGLQLSPTQRIPPGPETQRLEAEQSRQRLILDDGRLSQNPDRLPWPAELLSAGQSIRVGDQVDNLEGILDYRFGHWRLQPSRAPSLLTRNPRPTPPERPAGSLRVVNLNLGNLFNGDGRGNGFASSRGAETPDQYRRQLDRLVYALNALNPDILAVAEIENDGYGDNSALADLATRLGEHWRFVTTPGKTGQDAIRTDLLYRSDRVAPVGSANRLQQGVYLDQGRPPIAQVFREVRGSDHEAGVFRVVAAHLKSKGCRGADGLDEDQGDGEGCYSHRRAEEARAITRWLTGLPRAEGMRGTLVTGDLNSYAREKPIQTFESAGYTHLIPVNGTCAGGLCPPATYLFKGRLGTLDYSLASAGLEEYVVSAGVWAINAQEFPALGYKGALTAPSSTPWRVSDHNPLFMDLRF